LDGEAATVLCAQLLTLDAEGDQPIRLELQGLDAELPAALTVMGVLDVLRVPVTGYVAGQLAGAGLGLLAACTHRQAYPSAILTLTEPKLSLGGTAAEVSRQEEQVAAMMDTLYIRLAEVTGREVDDLRADARRGRFFTVSEAVSYGLIEGQATGGDTLKAAAVPRRPAESFILANTTLGTAPLVPEIRLHLASDAIELWEQTEQGAGPAQLPPPFWAFPWAGGQALARYLLDHPALVRGRTVLDVAAGSGLVALAAARAGAASVTPTETDPL